MDNEEGTFFLRGVAIVSCSDSCGWPHSRVYMGGIRWTPRVVKNGKRGRSDGLVVKNPLCSARASGFCAQHSYSGSPPPVTPPSWAPAHTRTCEDTHETNQPINGSINKEEDVKLGVFREEVGGTGRRNGEWTNYISWYIRMKFSKNK